ncbi:MULTISPECIES: tetratricopeptide repeat protein [Spirosoma]|uniref:Tetratricopeptide repeat protein n=1 Tax=Spirosoma sordidisoli TaxID=2502893 RepID=A0A4Q2UGP8_9BACT|nr:MULTISPECIES: tetratricopeptide repeat protein [Spirosoma]RYC68517.1 tetratricopeptide repeat protein [Spirosoma sordidisoli]
MKRFLLISLIWPGYLLAQDNARQIEMTQLLLIKNHQVLSGNKQPDGLAEHSETVLRKAERYRYQGDFDKAVPLYQQAAQLNPKRQGYIGYVHLAFLHDYSRAMQYLNAYDALTPTFDDIEGNNPVSYYRGVIYLKTNEFALAIEQLNKSIGDIERKHGSEWVNYRYYVSRARAFLATSQPQKALDDLDKAVANYKKSALAYYHRGLALVQLGRTAEAKSAFQDAQFFFGAKRVEALQAGQAVIPEDQLFPLYESEIEAAIDQLKLKP